MRILKWILNISLGCAILSGAVSCLKTNYQLGYSIVPDTEKCVTRIVSVPIPSVKMQKLDKISGYSSLRMCVGSIKDDTFGYTRHASAFTLIPVTPTVDWGCNLQIISFTLVTNKDTLSLYDETEQNIIQNFHAYASQQPLDSTVSYVSDPRLSIKRIKETCKEVSLGNACYNGGDSLRIRLSNSFAKTYIPDSAFLDCGCAYPDTIEIEDYTQKHPGLYLTCDDPVIGNGRLNMFDIALDYDSDTYYVNSCYAELRFKADFDDRLQVDTSCLFCIGPTDFTSSSSYYAFNVCEHDYTNASAGVKQMIEKGKAGELIQVQGGTGHCPVFDSRELRKLVRDAVHDTLVAYNKKHDERHLDSLILHNGLVINKATIYLHFDYDNANYKRYKFYPTILNPSIRAVDSSDTSLVAYGGLTDASVASENQGTIDRSICCYHPDISHHLQEILQTPEDSLERFDRENIWLLTLANEIIITASSSSSTDDYYAQMAYLNYYNNLMGGGSGYGSYGGYDAYSNYYSYYMMQSYYNSSSSTTTETQMLDINRYYNASLIGPDNPDRSLVPTLELTYTILNNKTDN